MKLDLNKEDEINQNLNKSISINESSLCQNHPIVIKQKTMTKIYIQIKLILTIVLSKNDIPFSKCKTFITFLKQVVEIIENETGIKNAIIGKICDNLKNINGQTISRYAQQLSLLYDENTKMLISKCKAIGIEFDETTTIKKESKTLVNANIIKDLYVGKNELRFISKYALDALIKEFNL